MKKQVIFIHGGNAYSSYENYLIDLQTKTIWDPQNIEAPKRWRDTICTEFGSKHEVFYPAMPNSKNAHYLEWRIWFERYFAYITSEVILVGHSLGGYFLAKYLSENTVNFPIAALYLVASPFTNSTFDTGEDGGDFNFDTNLLPNITKQVPHIVIVHSEDDAVVPFSHAKQFHVALPEAKCMYFKDRGHFLEPEFPEIIEDIRTHL